MEKSLDHHLKETEKREICSSRGSNRKGCVTITALHSVKV